MGETLELEAASSTTLTVIPATAISTIIAADKDDILGGYAAKVRAFKPDVSTVRGRDEIKSLAAEGRRVKASLLRLAGGLKEDALKTQRAINAEEKIIEERMNALVENIRAPLTEFENVEKARVAGHEAALATMQRLLSEASASGGVDLIDARLEDLERAHNRDWQHDFKARAADVYSETFLGLQRHRQQASHLEAEAAELARLRAEAEERARQEAARLQAEREARIAAEAADKARRDAEAQAKREREETLRVAAEERARVERAAQAEQRRIEAERQAAHDRAEEAERRRAAEATAALVREESAARKVEADRIAAEQKAKRDQEAAVAAERKRQADEQARVDREAATAKAEADKRAANRAHQAAINGAAVKALLALTNIDEQIARQVVTAVARGEIPAMRLEY